MRSIAAATGMGQALGALAESIGAQATLVRLVLAYAICVFLVSVSMGYADQTWPVLYVLYLIPKTLVLLAVFVFARLVHAMVIVRPARLVEHVWRDFTANPETHRQLAAGLPLVVLLPMFLAVFASFKVLIPEINFYGWDATFATWDRLVHGGRDPWLVLQTILGHPLVTYAIDLLYGGWFAVLQLVCIWQAFSLKRPQLRMQFFLAFVVVWIVLGNVGATLLSSAGPCFFGAIVGGNDPYGPLMDYLRGVDSQHPLLALKIQGMLWHGYLNPEMSIVRGISAMPSIHVSMACLMALLGWRVNRWLGTALTVYLAVIMVGSVHLGWHYAVDGYAGIVGTYAIWRAVGWALARRGATVAIPATR